MFRRVLIEKRSIDADATVRMGKQRVRYCMSVVNATANCTYPCVNFESYRSRSTRYITANFLVEGKDFVAFR
jgi:hypothetical protein